LMSYDLTTHVLVNFSPTRPKIAPTWSQNGPKMAPQDSEGESKTAQDGQGPKIAQDDPKMDKTATRQFKLAPRWPPRWLGDLRRPEMAPRWPHDGAIWPHDGAIWPKMA
jgi:hypothetical protein